jgi:hypothetical protein
MVGVEERVAAESWVRYVLLVIQGGKVYPVARRIKKTFTITAKDDVAFDVAQSVSPRQLQL